MAAFCRFCISTATKFPLQPSMVAVANVNYYSFSAALAMSQKLLTVPRPKNSRKSSSA